MLGRSSAEHFTVDQINNGFGMVIMGVMATTV
jgi:hypothetical protein